MQKNYRKEKEKCTTKTNSTEILSFGYKLNKLSIDFVYSKMRKPGLDYTTVIYTGDFLHF